MPPKKILFCGVTGVEKKEAMRRLANWCKTHRTRECTVIDFDSEFLFSLDQGGRRWYDFLDDSFENQRSQWTKSWQALLKDPRMNVGDRDLFLGVHGCIVRGHSGVRCAVGIRELSEFAPDCIITLLDDVYDMWWRTESRAGDEAYRGIPTLEQLIFARRTELLVADQIASYSSSHSIPHFMVSVSHPCETLANNIYSEERKIVYLCFPISAPREMISKRDLSGAKEITNFIKKAYEFQSQHPELIVTCPLTIDELPLCEARNSTDAQTTTIRGKETVDAINFDRETSRWSLNSAISPDSVLSPGPLDKANRRPIPVDQLQSASGMIITDVGWRDFRLVEQADYLAVFNPVFKNRETIARSVNEEIQFAIGNGTPCYVYQNPEHDPSGALAKCFPDPGTMGPGPSRQMVVAKNSVDEVFRSILRG